MQRRGLNPNLLATAILLSSCSSGPRPFLELKEFNAPRESAPLTKEQAAQFLNDYFQTEIHPPASTESQWQTAVGAGSSLLPIKDIPYCDQAVTELNSSAEKTRLSASMKLNMAECIKKAQGSGRSAQEQKLIQALLGSLKFEETLYVENSCSKRDLRSAKSWKVSDMAKAGVGSRLCLEDATQRVLWNSKKKISYKIGNDAPSTTLSRAEMLAVGKPCIRNFSKGTLRIRRCSTFIKTQHTGTEVDRAAKDIVLLAYAKDLVGVPGQPYYGSGTYSLTINQWKGTLKFRAATQPPTYTLTNGKESFDGTLALKGSPESAPANPKTEPTKPTHLGPPETEPIVGVFQILGFTPPTAAESYVLPYRDGTLITNNSRKILPTLLQIACDRIHRICWGMSSSDVGPVNLKNGELNSFTKEPGTPKFSSLAGLAFDAKTQRLFVIAGKDQGSLFTYGQVSKTWGTPAQLNINNIQGMVFMSGDRSLYVISAEEKSSKASFLTKLTKINPDGTTGTSVPLTFEIPFGFAPNLARIQLIDASPYILFLVTNVIQPGATNAKPLPAKNRFLPTEVFRVDPFTGTVHLIK